MTRRLEVLITDAFVEAQKDEWAQPCGCGCTHSLNERQLLPDGDEGIGQLLDSLWDMTAMSAMMHDVSGVLREQPQTADLLLGCWPLQTPPPLLVDWPVSCYRDAQNHPA